MSDDLLFCQKEGSPQRMSVLLRGERRWQQTDGGWHSGRPMRDERKHAINIYWQGGVGYRTDAGRWQEDAACGLLKGPLRASALRLTPGARRETWIVITGPVADLLLAGGQLDLDRPLCALADPKLVAERLHLLAEAMRGRRSWPECLARLQALCASIWAPDPVCTDPDRQAIEQAVRFDPAADWSLASLAALCGCRAETLRQRFHRRHGCGPTAVVMQVRMELAGGLLADHLVKQVARQLGYGDQRSFSRQFRRHYGITPQAYRGLSSSR